MNEKKLNLRTYFIMAIFMGSMFLAPSVANINAQDDDGFDNVTSEEGVMALQGALGQMFGMFREFGASGEVLAQVFELMFTDFATINATKKGDGVFVLNASIINPPKEGMIFYDSLNGSGTFQPWGPYIIPGSNERPYFSYEHNGNVTYNQTEGVSITLIIWDSDNSFIDALDKLISAVKGFMEISEEAEQNESKAYQDAISLAVETITYFLIHINDIITGDEVIIANIIAFTDYEADILGDFTTGWYSTTNRRQTEEDEPLIDVYGTFEQDYRNIAESINDEWMLYLLDGGWNSQRQQNYTAFSFDLIQIWLKNFHIEIDVAAILEAVQTAEQYAQAGQEPEGPLTDSTMTDIFDGLDIEFYVFTHHFQNWYLYNDSKFSNDAVYGPEAQAKANNGVPDILLGTLGETDDGTPIQYINDTEVTHYLLFRGADEWIFNEPEYTGINEGEEFSMKWGIEAQSLNFRCLPLGLEDGDVDLIDAPIENMEYFKLGFTFEPSIEENTVEAGQWSSDGMGVAKVKLDQEFGLWNDGNGPNTPGVSNSELDFASVFMSTVFHFHLKIENEVLSNTTLNEDDPLLTENNYDNSTGKINVGTAAATAIQEDAVPLSSIDIAGPDYEQTDGGGTTTEHPARTSIIPMAYAQWEGQASGTYDQQDGSTGVMSGVLNIEFSVLLYAISFDSFDGSGDQIIHDPIFSVYITTENIIPIAVILVIGTIVLVGVAAMLITKKKDSSLN